MKSRFVMAAMAAVVAGATAVTVLPVDASAQRNNKDKSKKEDPNALKLTPAIIKPANAARTAIEAGDVATAEPLLAQAEAAAVTDDDKFITATLRYNLEITRNLAARQANPNAPINETSLAAPLDALIASARTTPADRAKFAFKRGALAFNGKSYAQAVQYFTQAKQLGYADNNIDALIAKAKMESGDVAGGAADLQAAVAQAEASGQKAPESYYRYVIAQANGKKDAAQTLDWMTKYVSAYPTPKNWRDMIVVYGLQQNSVAKLDDAQKVDLYRLMRATHSLADEYDYKLYAEKVNSRGLSAEAAGVLQEGIAAGKLQPGDADVKLLMSTAQGRLKSEGSLAPAAARAASSADGKLAAVTGDAYLGAKDYAKAADLYRTALQKGGVDVAEVNTRLGIALAMSGDKAAARAAFDKVSGTRAGVAALWKASLGAPAPVTPA